MSKPNIALSHTLWSPSDTVKDVAESLGIASVTEDVAKNLAMDVEYRIHEILEQAIKFMRHGKRKTMTTQDIDRALKVLNLEPLYGYDVSRPLIFKEALVGAGQNLYYVEDEEVDFEKLINAPLPKLPRHTTFTAHWLAIEGVQPTIPQNPTPSEIRTIPPIHRGSMENMLTVSGDDATVSGPSLESSKASGRDVKSLEVKPLVKHVLSKELQLYFDRVLAALVDEREDEQVEYLRNAALESIRTDPGLHQLVPYFIQFVAETITHNLKNINLLSTMLHVIYSLLTNESIFLEPYIHALMPCILTLLLAKKIGTASPEAANHQTHFELRALASSLLEFIIENYGSSYSTLKPRITRTLLKAFFINSSKGNSNDPKRLQAVVGTQYGAILGLKSMGAEVIRVILVGNMRNWSNVVLETLAQLEDQQDYKVLVDVIMECLRLLKVDHEPSQKKQKGNDGEETLEDGSKLRDRVGDRLASEIEKQQDAREIVDGMFFAEV